MLVVANDNKALGVECVQYAFSILDSAANMMQPVYEVRKIEKSRQIPSSLKNYFPSSMKDVETQMFNIARVLPPSIKYG